MSNAKVRHRRRRRTVLAMRQVLYVLGETLRATHKDPYVPAAAWEGLRDTYLVLMRKYG